MAITPEEIKKAALAIYNEEYVGTYLRPDELADILIRKVRHTDALVGYATELNKALDARLAQE